MVLEQFRKVAQAGVERKKRARIYSLTGAGVREEVEAEETRKVLEAAEAPARESRFLGFNRGLCRQAILGIRDLCRHS